MYFICRSTWSWSYNECFQNLSAWLDISGPKKDGRNRLWSQFIPRWNPLVILCPKVSGAHHKICSLVESVCSGDDGRRRVNPSVCIYVTRTITNQTLMCLSGCFRMCRWIYIGHFIYSILWNTVILLTNLFYLLYALYIKQ